MLYEVMNGEDNMAPLRHHSKAELELLEALSDVVRQEPDGRPVGNCPNVADLERFAVGKYGTAPNQLDELLNHLAVCDRCIDFLTQFRKRQELIRRSQELIRKRRELRRTTALALASVAVLVIALWASLQHSSRVLVGVATIDLRLISPTRGQVPGPRQTATVRKASDGLRVVLPVGSEGNYEMEILAEDTKPTLVRGSGSTRLEGHDVVLNLPVNLSHLKSGKYLLALRRGNGAEWEYYSLTLE